VGLRPCLAIRRSVGATTHPDYLAASGQIGEAVAGLAVGEVELGCHVGDSGVLRPVLEVGENRLAPRRSLGGYLFSFLPGVRMTPTARLLGAATRITTFVHWEPKGLEGKGLRHGPTEGSFGLAPGRRRDRSGCPGPSRMEAIPWSRGLTAAAQAA